MDLGGEPRTLDTSNASRCMDLAFSPDGKWLAYVWWPKASTSIVRIADCESGDVFDATEALREDRSPAWDPEGKYLYFISARDFNPIYDALQFDLSFPQAMRPYVMTLRTDVANPFVPVPAPLHAEKDEDDEDDDADGDEKDEKAKKPPKPVLIDRDGIAHRILAFPVDEGQYQHVAGTKGKAIFSVFPVTGIKPSGHGDDEAGGALMAYDFTAQRSGTLAGDIDGFVLGADGRTLVYESRGHLRAIDAGGDLPEDDPEDKPATEMNRRSGWVDLSRIGVQIEPRDEWAQMLREAWRLQREQFWDAQMSGVDWPAVLERYAALLPRIRTRAELSDLIWEMQGELGTSHAYEMGGDNRRAPQYRRGFLGADYTWDAARSGYRIEAILRGDSWNRTDDSPLAEPGIDARAGDVIVAVGGTRVSASRTPGELLVNLADRDVALDIERDGKTRRVLVHALRSETMLRYRAWVNANRALVHERTGGRVGYVHIPDMGPWGFAEFHRGYLTEFERDGLIVDVRYNRGGHVSPLLLEKLARKRVGYDVSRYGPEQPYPPESLGGPLVAITNQFAGSDGDIFSHCFKLYGLGPLVGMRTWGGVVGINPYHSLADGTTTTQPEYSFWFVDAGWQVENYGTDPDVELDIAPQDSAAGVDPQMNKALELISAAIEKAPAAAGVSARSRSRFSAPPRAVISEQHSGGAALGNFPIGTPVLVVAPAASEFADIVRERNDPGRHVRRTRQRCGRHAGAASVARRSRRYQRPRVPVAHRARGDAGDAPLCLDRKRRELYRDRALFSQANKSRAAIRSRTARSRRCSMRPGWKILGIRPLYDQALVAIETVPIRVTIAGFGVDCTDAAMLERGRTAGYSVIADPA